MQFHEYVNLRNETARNSSDPALRRLAKSLNAGQFRSRMIADTSRAMDESKIAAVERGSPWVHFSAACAEDDWVDLERPFYNVWPIALELANTVRLDIPLASVTIPVKSLLLRLANGHELHDVATALVWSSEVDHIWVFGRCLTAPKGHERLILCHPVEPDDTVETWLSHVLEAPGGEAIAGEAILRLTILVGLLANDEDVITPVVLSKDRARYEAADPDTKKWLEDRAARRLGRGFDIGKKLELERESSPHWRNPHLALFWTGPGRTKPIIKMRRGSVVQRVNMAEVPTGFLGPETAAENELADATAARVQLSASLRFDVLKRDSFRCQLCGASADDGARLHVDHMKPVAKGGTNVDSNLWTLCEKCNLGKSDKELH